ncbi:hypothetical protein [Cyclobacterium plantarum]|uniref:DUF5723 domain-containing protein n=1 Tax=Cyclobacterium plantarum TaxID=2716263 RepID=A0ABX0H7Q2_9BACT|nr:hypothetical protein [Cyclobacterium plantarum]NHE56418.1 hypothetical protein [Cyclobacterium plantarum]
MKKYIYIIIISFSPVLSWGQILNQDANGKSSIVWQGSSLNIDIGETLIKINHFDRSNKVYKAHEILYGFDLQAKNEGGMGNLFQEGEFTPNANFSSIIGLRKVYYKHNEFSEEERRLQNQKFKLAPLAFSEYQELIRSNIKGCTINGIESPSSKKLRDRLDLLTTLGWFQLENKIIESIISIDEKDTCKSKLESEVLLLAESVKNNLNIQKMIQIDLDVRTIQKENRVAFVSNKMKLFYFRPSLSALEFKYDRGNDSQDFSARFIDTLQIGYTLEVGMTVQNKLNYYGINLGYSFLNNFLNLDHTTFRYSERDSSITSGALTRDETFKAYSGNYGTFGNIILNLDYLRMFKLGPSQYILLGPYLRQNFSFNRELFDHYSVFGIHMNYLNGKSGKFLGGVYVQSDDISGRLNPNFTKTIRFGLITRLNLGSVFGL